jgi:hypothetical protein
MSVIDALAPVNPFDFNYEAAKEAAHAAFVKIETYPGIDNFKRRVLRTHMPDHYIYKSNYLLKGIALNNECSPAHFALLKQDLAKALQLIEEEISEIE